MQNTAPFNTDVPEYQPSREAPIYPSIVKRYPCQEDNVFPEGEPNKALRSLTWKIQQPDSSMVWTAVKLVMPMKIAAYNNRLDQVDMRVGSRLPACNVALSETVMRCFRDTQLTLNGKVFNEVNYYRDVLDTCYRGVGPQSYGDNHSLKPVVTRALASRHPEQTVNLRQADGTSMVNIVRIDDIRNFITSNNESLLDNNGPFLERARLWQDGLSVDGKEWNGNVTAYLEAGPFQARARKGNTAVPYIEDFHLKLNFIQNESRYDQLRKHNPNIGEFPEVARGRILAAHLLEFGTVVNMQVPGEEVNATDNFLGCIGTTFTQKPYLEVTYTKFLDPLRSSYLLRCYERQYQTSLPRFKLPPQVGGSIKKTARVTSRLLSYPTKIYVYAEVADEWKGTYLFGGVRRSCMLDNIHCRINQRPDVIYNPSQEECFETFQRHTNSSLEYGAWRKSPIYVFTPSDLRQSDMYANDARITWMEWDAEVSLTKLQNDEHIMALGTKAITAAGYVRGARDELTYVTKTSVAGQGSAPLEVRMDPIYIPLIKEDTAKQGLQIYAERTDQSEVKHPCQWHNAEELIVSKPFVQMVYTSIPTGTDVAIDSDMDVQITNVENKSMQLDGYIWAMLKTTGGAAGAFVNDAVYYVPRSYRFTPEDGQPGVDPYNFVNDYESLVEEEEKQNPGGANLPPVYLYRLKAGQLAACKVARGAINDQNAKYTRDQKKFGQANDPANWDDVAPGDTCLRYDHHGMRNMDNTYSTADMSGQTYTDMGPMELKKTGGVNKVVTVNEKTGIDSIRWVCFAPPTAFVGTELDHFRFRSNTHATVADTNSPVVIGVGTTVETSYGRQRIYVYGTAANASVDTVIQDQFASHAPDLQFDHTEGRRMAELVVDPSQSTDDIQFDYQLKALYEYGNCQYEFTSDGAPSRVVDNLIPVGPSAGIPTF